MTHLMTSHRRPLAADRAGWPILVFLASAALLLARGLWGGRLLPGLPIERFGFFDLKIYREAAQVTLEGHSLYAAKFQLGFGFTYPPVAVLMFLVLAVVPLRVDEASVVVLNLGLVVLIAHLTVALARQSTSPSERRRLRPGAAWIAAALALWTEPVISTIGFGQIDLLITALVLADLTLGRRGRWGGLGIGAAAALKLTPLIFIPYLLFTGRGRMAARALGGFLSAIVLAFAVEPGNAWSYWGGALFDTSRVTGHRPFAGRGPANQSLRGALMRLAGGVPHVADPWFLICVLVGAAGLWLAVRSARRGDEASGFVLTAITGLLICPVSWTHHWVITVPGLMLAMVSADPGDHGRRGQARALGVTLCALSSPLIWLEIVRDPNGAHLGAGGLLLGDLYVLAGLGTIVVAGAREWSLARSERGHALGRTRAPRRGWSPAGPQGYPGAPVRALPTGQAVPLATQSLR
jgi:alpha-1,2-mannosyltransferase